MYIYEKMIWASAALLALPTAALMMRWVMGVLDRVTLLS